jgi:hypothetical protein
MGMRPDRTGERQHAAADLLILLAAVTLALTTWACLSGLAGVPIWKSYTSVAITLCLALAALTRNPAWAASIRVLTGVWLMSAPYLLAFAAITPALWTYITVGAILVVLAFPSFKRRTSQTTILA